MKSRIAPTPSGYLHQGNAFNFLLTNRLVKASSGELVLRIDDMDGNRIRDEYLEHIFSTLRQLGVEWQYGPRSINELTHTWSQRKRLNQYQKHLQLLKGSGLIYACSCSRKEIARASKNGNYPGTCRSKGLDLDQAGLAWRINTKGAGEIQLPTFEGLASPPIDLERRLGDFVVRKKDGLPAYQLCSISDDLTMEINLIVRGEDLLSSSAAQVFLAELLGEKKWLSELVLLHHPLILGDDGSKLSKSAGATAIATHSGDEGDLAIAQINDKIKGWLRKSNNPWLASIGE